ncbi:hypothetical protein KR51_00014760 [Rubidibacter lacunae KORDI 51-2]|uniref:Transposase n=1 Tax=Rubidibacter lacunae KORDI 51-2 TaxID=582515 RepID=U5DJL5_9CHRO|nr:hypothetical protein KR51_00014760 [Rubidibacter lacunae KORDI 51-2]
MPGQHINQSQIQVYKCARDVGCSQKISAHIAGFSESSGSRIETGKHQPASQREPKKRTRPDPLAEVWAQELEPLLRRDPRLTPTTLFEYLIERYPGQYDRQKRTLQRRVREWKALHGNPKEVMFESHHQPGRMGLSDFSKLKRVGITIKGEPFEHLLYHYRLAYSGWQYVQAVQGGESFVALSEGLQNALYACGGVPQQHRTDSLSAAYRNRPGQKRQPLTQFYEVSNDNDIGGSKDRPVVRGGTGLVSGNEARTTPDTRATLHPRQPSVRKSDPFLPEASLYECQDTRSRAGRCCFHR